MKKYQASTPNAEIIGAALKPYYSAITHNDFKHILEQYDLNEIDPEQWYPQQLTLDVQKRIFQGEGGSQNLVAIGMKIIDDAIFPPMNSLEEAVNAFASSYPMNFRNQSADDLIHAEFVDDQTIRVVNGSPHSDDMIYGYIYGLVRRFREENKSFSVEYEDISKRDSDEDTVFIVHYGT